MLWLKSEILRLVILGAVMNLSTRHRPLTALLMSFVMTTMSLPIGVAHAGMVSTETIIEQRASGATASDQDQGARERIRALLDRDDVRAQMVDLGITPSEAEARIAALTDQEIADIAGRLDTLPAGEGLGGVLIILFIAFGVAVMLDALGMVNIFPFVCGPGQCGGASQQVYYPEPAAPPPPADAYRYDDRRPYRPDQPGDQRYRQSPPSGYDQNPYYEPQTRPRNYYEERFGAQRYVR